MFIPIGDDNTRRKTFPFVVWVFFTINGFVWFLQLSIGPEFTFSNGAIPFELVNNTDLTEPTELQFNGETQEIPHQPGPSPIYLTVLFSMFMHGSWGHIISNMLYLVIFADQIEDYLGHTRFFVFYILCGLVAAASHIFVQPESTIPMIGASGAIAGVLGAYLIKYPLNAVKVWIFFFIVKIPAFIVLGGWIFTQLATQVSLAPGQSTGVAYMAHIGGFFAGVILVNRMNKAKKDKNVIDIN